MYSIHLLIEFLYFFIIIFGCVFYAEHAMISWQLWGRYGSWHANKSTKYFLEKGVDAKIDLIKLEIKKSHPLTGIYRRVLIRALFFGESRRESNWLVIFLFKTFAFYFHVFSSIFMDLSCIVGNFLDFKGSNSFFVGKCLKRKFKGLRLSRCIITWTSKKRKKLNSIF